MAEAELSAGATAALEQVRIKHERAARVFIDLAEAEDARLAGRVEVQAAQAARVAQAAKVAD